ncbi:IDEAL domain-containing protein [Sediminibacillus massiliensis]|uniref:IDEAL domain-containing protein n=1 Tax=Sediminibacillus massiliensis TaxID=1926277 RepID=UPI0009888AE5|nr:IDEAL domain-containing protein [Sediminibacillus massiliensis]
METNYNPILQVGDWVKTKTKNGELVHGYLENFQAFNSKVELKVVVSDNEKLIGNSIKTEPKNVKKISTHFEHTEKQLEDLIDLALLTKDREWFNDLSAEINRRKQKTAPKSDVGSNGFEKPNVRR